VDAAVACDECDPATEYCSENLHGGSCTSSPCVYDAYCASVPHACLSQPTCACISRATDSPLDNGYACWHDDAGLAFILEVQ